MRQEVRLYSSAAAVVLATLAACAVYWWQLTAAQVQLRADTLQQAELRALQLANAVAGQMEATVRGVDFAVRHLGEMYGDGLQGEELDGVARDMIADFPAGAIVQVAVIGSDGYLAYSSLGKVGKVYVGDREHFRIHLDAARDRLFISEPMLGRVSKAWSIQFTRPIHRRGRFAGVAVLSLSPAYLGSRVALLQLGHDDVFALVRADGGYLFRSPDPEAAMGKSVPPQRPFVGEASPAQGTLRATAAFDQSPRIFAWRRLEEVPLTAVLGLGERPLLAPVESAMAASRQRTLAGMLLVMLMSSAIAFLLVRAGMAQRALAASEHRYRSFFERNASVKLIVDPDDGAILDANAAAAEFYGYSRERLRAMRITEINCLPAEEVREEMGRAKTERRLYFRFPHRLASGEIRQVEVYSGPGELDGRLVLFSIVHDVTERYELERKLRESEALHRTLIETMAEGVLLVDGEGRITAWNGAALAILDISPEALTGGQVKAIDADGNPLPRERLPSQRAARGEPLEHYLCGVERADGSHRWLTVSARGLAGGEGPHGNAAVISFSDVTRLVEAEEAQRLAQSVFEAAAEGILVTDEANRIVAVNPAFSRITGYGAEEVMGRDPHLLAAPAAQDAAFYRGMWQRLLQDGQWEGEITNRRKDGEAYVEWLKISVIRDGRGKPRRFVALFSDVTERRRQQELVWRQANFDALTGLPNRQLLLDRLERAMAQAGRKQTNVAVLFVDLDCFKPVNDRHGHAAGDDLLRQVARRLELSLRDEDTIARLGGDEFVVVLPDIRGGEAAAKTADKLIAVLSEPFRLGEHFVEISCSVGVVLFPDDGRTAADLIERSDEAMYAAKQAGRATWRTMAGAR